MAKRVYSDIQKFKGVELALRGATNGFRDAIAKIDEALSNRRTENEIALLKSIRDQVAKLRQDASTVLHRLYSEVDSSASKNRRTG
jgi:hypothetical protein